MLFVSRNLAKGQKCFTIVIFSMIFFLLIVGILDHEETPETKENLPQIYIITPTYPKAVQLAELTRLGYVLQNVKNIHWIIAEDSTVPTQNVVQFLEQLDVITHYLLSPMPEYYRKKPWYERPKGVSNRVAGLDWIYNYTKSIGDTSGVLYFADDDNTYDIRLFEEIRKTKTVSVFPVGIVAGQYVSSPVLDKNGKFKKFFDGWMNGGRKYPLDMAGFAVGVNHYLDMVKKFKKSNGENESIMKFKRGYEEDSFLKNMNIPPEKLEFLCENCSKIYVWHTQTKTPDLKKGLKISVDEAKNTNLGDINNFWCFSGINNFNCSMSIPPSP